MERNGKCVVSNYKKTYGIIKRPGVTPGMHQGRPLRHAYVPACSRRGLYEAGLVVVMHASYFVRRIRPSSSKWCGQCVRM